MNRFLLFPFFVFFIILFASCINEAQIGCSAKRYVRLVKDKPISEQLKWDCAVYEICDIIDMHGETVKVPAKSKLVFKNGMLKNGALTGNYKIVAPSNKIFENVDISSYTSPLKFSWFVGNRKVLFSKDFKKLPSVRIDFERVNYTAGECLVWDKMNGFDFVNLNLESSYDIHFWLTPITEYFCSPVGDSNNYQGKIKTSVSLPKSFEGYLIEITTADRTKYDYRPDKDGVPSLYKGLSTTISKIDRDGIRLKDELEFFSAERVYNNSTVKSKCRVFKPKKFTLSNCNFIFSNKAGISLRGVDFLIEKCKFEACDGANSLVSLGGCYGLVKDCIVKGAFYSGTHTSYGIQIVKGANIVIENCEFFENRRGVDFSGGFESRYNEVRDCVFHQQKNVEKTGSAMGGHATSYGNIYRNNVLYGDYQVGIQCRGENEIIEGNHFYCNASTMIVFAYNTQILNNIIEASAGSIPGVFAASGIKEEGNVLRVLNNKVEIRKIFINGDSNITYDVYNNEVLFSPTVSSEEPIVFSHEPENYIFSHNKTECSKKNKVIKLTDKKIYQINQ